MISVVDVCKKMTMSQWTVNSKMIFKLRDGVDGPSLHCTMDVLTPFGTLHVWECKNSNPKAMVIHAIANIRRHDVDCWFKAIKGGDGEFTKTYQCEKGDSETGPHGWVKRIFGVKLGKQRFDKVQGEGLPLGTFEGWWCKIGSPVESGSHLVIIHGPRLTMENVPHSYTKNVVGKSGTQIGASTAGYEHYYEEQSHGASLRIGNVV